MWSWIHRTGLGLAMFGGLGVGAANAQQAPSSPAKVYRPGKAFRLPVSISDTERMELRELKFYVKTSGGEWVCKETAPPNHTGFVFRAIEDGEYWFSIVTVDRSGRANPANLDREPPSLIVVIDNLIPELEVHPMTLGSDVCLRCVMKDANPDYSTLKAEWQLGNGQVRVLEPMSGDTPGVFKLSGTMGGQVRFSFADKAGNTGNRVVDLTQFAVAPAAPANPVAPAALVPVAASLPMPSQPIVPALASTPAAVGTPAPSSTHVSQMTPTVGQIVNTPHLAIDYALDPIAYKSIGKLEFWATANNGQTWSLVGTDKDKTSPAELHLSGEGTFGIVCVPVRVNAPGNVSPKAGEKPESIVEVDTTPPVVSISGATIEGEQIHLEWTASDKNLSETPVTVEWSAGPAGPWQPVGPAMPNTGSASFPGQEGYVRLTVRDKAGNITSAISPSVRGTMPKPKILGVGPAAK